MEHLLSGVAAVEEKSKNENSETPPASASSATPSHSEASASGSASSPSKDLKNASFRGETMPIPIQPLPKLPPISSLTQMRSLMPSQPTTAAVMSAMAVPSKHTSRQSATGSVATHDEGLCRYRNKLCMNARALKRNGELHNLCEKHRAKANQNQRKLESKRRVQKRQIRQPAPSATSSGSRAFQLSPEGTSSMAAAAMQIHQQYQMQQLQAQPHAMRIAPGMLPSLAQLQRLPPPAPSSSGQSRAPSYPY